MNGINNIAFFPMGTRAILMTWNEDINPHLLEKIGTVKTAVQHKKEDVIFEIINTYNALLIKYKQPFSDFDKETNALKEIVLSAKSGKRPQQSRYCIPVCYDEKWGIDLHEIATQKQLSPTALVELHTAPIYTVYFTGFLPGFPYLGGLSKKLYIDRKKNPRNKIPKGAVGIGGQQTGIYPTSSPGGWQIIGNCPIDLFDISKPSPSLFQSGDQVKFESVSIEEYQDIQEKVKNQTYTLRTEPCP